MPYKSPYDALPHLIKLDRPIFQPDQYRFLYLRVKRRHDKPALFHLMDEKALAVIIDFLNEELKDYPDYKPAKTLKNIGMQIQEDLVIQHITDNDDWLAAAHVSLPTGWNPIELMGLTFAQLHADIPYFPQNKALIRSMLKGRFRRYLWTIKFSEELSAFNPDYFRPFNGLESVRIRIEDQTIIPFPEHNASLFVLKPYYVKPDLAALRNTILGMDEKQLVAKIPSREFYEAILGQNEGTAG